MVLLEKMSVPHPMRERASAVEKMVRVERPHNRRHIRIGDWT
jgi:hypothetical protein